MRMDAKGDALAVLAALGVPMAALQVTADAPGFYHPGRSGVVRQGPKIVLATFGEIAPEGAAPRSTCRARPWPSRSSSMPCRSRSAARRARPTCPPSSRCGATSPSWWTRASPAEALLRAARGADKALVADVALFDRLSPARSVPEGKVSLAIQVTLQPREATLTDAQIEAVADRIVAAVAKATGATLRA